MSIRKTLVLVVFLLFSIITIGVAIRTIYLRNEMKKIDATYIVEQTDLGIETVITVNNSTKYDLYVFSSNNEEKEYRPLSNSDEGAPTVVYSKSIEKFCTIYENTENGDYELYNRLNNKNYTLKVYRTNGGEITGKPYVINVVNDTAYGSVS